MLLGTLINSSNGRQPHFPGTWPRGLPSVGPTSGLSTILDLGFAKRCADSREFISPYTSSVRRRKTMNADGVADLDRHQVFTKLNRTCIVLPYKSKYGSRRPIVVGKHGELWLRPLEHPPGFRSVGMVLADCLPLPTGQTGAWQEFVRWSNQRGICFRPRDLVNQHVNALRKPDQVVRGLRVSGHNDRVTVIVNAEPESGLGKPMIDKECRDLDTVRLVNDAFANIGREDLDALG